MTHTIKTCACGCGQIVKSDQAMYVIGHYSKGNTPRQQDRVLTCAYCGKQFKKISRSIVDQLYCCHACYVAKLRQLSPNKPEKRSCKHCGSAFMTSARNPKQNYCNSTCFNDARRVYTEVPECQRCGKQIFKKLREAKKNLYRRFCSFDCYKNDSIETAGTGKDRRNPKKGHNKSLLARPQVCQLCGFDRYIEWAHLIPAREGGSTHSANIAMLCPNHHRLFDHGMLNGDELLIMDKLLSDAKADPRARLSLSKIGLTEGAGDRTGT